MRLGWLVKVGSMKVDEPPERVLVLTESKWGGQGCYRLTFEIDRRWEFNPGRVEGASRACTQGRARPPTAGLNDRFLSGIRGRVEVLGV